MSTTNDDLEHLEILVLFHYVVAALAALFGCIPLIHFFFGVAMVSGWGDFADSDPFSRSMGWLFIVLASAFIFAGWGFAVCYVFAGRFLSQHRRYTYCLIMAGIACMFMPFGTVLGVFTIIVLMRPTVKDLFGVVRPNSDLG